MKRSIDLVYLGRRGGGADLLGDLLKLIRMSHHDSRINLIVVKELEDNEIYEPVNGEKIVLNLSTGLKILNPIKIISEFRRIKDFQVQTNSNIILIVMPSVLDIIFFNRICQKNGKVVRIIHDHKSHKGEFWPTKLDILLRIVASHEIIFLSKYVASKFGKVIINKPHKLLPLFSMSENKGEEKKGIVFIGRGKRYQGVDLIPDLVASLSEKTMETITIAGSGFEKIRNSLPTAEIVLVDYWLSRIEFEEVLGRAKIVVLPYLEATQSGIIAKALKLNTLVVATPVGGLAEQFRNGVDGVLCGGTSLEEIVTGVMTAIQMTSPLGDRHEQDCRAWDALYE